METLLTPPCTKVHFEWPFELNPNTARVASCGSCFAENMVQVLSASGIQCMQNPNGILYNPHSLSASLLRVIRNQGYTKEDFFEYGGFWHSWEHHGSFSRPSLESAVDCAECSRTSFREFLRVAELLILTPASASVFELIDGNRIVANCHKLPGTLFHRRLLSGGECFSSLCGIVEAMAGFNPGCRIVFTLSPVRHNPGNLILNARSKALILNAIHDCADRFPHVFYFPAYEIVLDELRDYRFFKDDMLHPNDFAVKQVTRTFASACFGKASLRMLDDAEKRAAQSCHMDRRSG